MAELDGTTATLAPPAAGGGGGGDLGGGGDIFQQLIEVDGNGDGLGGVNEPAPAPAAPLFPAAQPPAEQQQQAPQQQSQQQLDADNPLVARLQALEQELAQYRQSQPDPAEQQRQEQLLQLDTQVKTLLSKAKFGGFTDDEAADLESTYRAGQVFNLHRPTLEKAAITARALDFATELLPPQATMADLAGFIKAVSGYPTPALMRQAAALHVQGLRQVTRDTRSAQGAERTESGGQGTINGQPATDIRTLEQRITNGTATAQDWAMYSELSARPAADVFA